MRQRPNDSPFVVRSRWGRIPVFVYVAAISVTWANIMVYVYFAFTRETLSWPAASMLATVIPLAIIPPLGWPFANAMLRLDAAQRELKALLQVDPLSDVLNRRGIAAEAAGRFGAAANLAAAMIDVDRFKAINDAHGHEAGDLVIAAVARRLKEFCARNGGCVGRWGGDEFCLFFEARDEIHAFRQAERLRLAIADIGVHVGGLAQARILAVTASVGVAFRRPEDMGFGDLLSRADAMLYEAKAGGRNKVVARIGAAAA